MPRQPRFWYPGAVLHVMQRGNNRGTIFTSDQDHARYLHWLRDAMTTHGVALHAYVLMSNHVHLLAAPSTQDAMPRMMQTLGRRYVGWFNHAHERTGTLWEGRYRATLVDTDTYLLACMRYIELNPVRAAIVSNALDYRWSSHRAHATGRADALVTPHPLYLDLGTCATSRRAAYRDWCGQGEGATELARIRDATRFEWVLGNASYCEAIKQQGRRASRLPPGRRRAAICVSDPV